MSLIKSLIHRLLDSRTTPAQAAHSAMPSSGGTEVSPGNDAYNDITMPFDGYVFQEVGGSASNVTYSLVRNMSKGIASQCNSTNGNASRAFVFAAKGDNVTVSRQATPKTAVTIRLRKALGGGYNHFVRRALSCLRPSFNFLLRSFSRVNGKQSKLGIFQKSETKLHSRQRQGKTLFSRLQRTDTFKSSCETTTRMKKNSPSLCTQAEMKTAVQGRNYKILMDGFLYIYPFSRVKLSRFSAQELSKTLSLRSIRTTNLQTGGALC